MAKKGKSPKPLKDPKHDEEGKIINWDSRWDDALVLQMYIEKGFVMGLTAGQVMLKYPEFDKYTNKALTGGLKTLRDSVGKEFAAQHAGGSNGGSGCIGRVNSFCCRLLSLTHLLLSFFDCSSPNPFQPSCWTRYDACWTWYDS